MRYTLLLHYPEAAEEDLEPGALEEAMAAFQAYATALEAAGVLVSAEVLQPVRNTTVVTMGESGPRVQDGPYADTKEQLGGTFVLDVPDLDVALAWAEKCPSLHWGAVEIRPTAVRFASGRWIPSD